MSELRLAYVGAERSDWAWQFEKAPLQLQEGQVLKMYLGQNDGNGWRQCGVALVRVEKRKATGEYPDHKGMTPTGKPCVCHSCRDFWVGVRVDE